MDQTPIKPDQSGLPLSADKTGGRLSRWFWPRGLSGKLLVITTIFIMLTEIFIFVPSVANYRLTWLARHFTTGEAAAIALLDLRPNENAEVLKEQLLNLTETEMIGLRHEGRSAILATRKMPPSVDRHVRVAEPGRLEALRSIMDAFDTLWSDGDRVIRVFGPMSQRYGVLELVMREEPLRAAMLGYARNVLLISLLISLATALLVFLTLRWFMIRPLQSMTGQMLAFARNPEDSNLIIKPSGRRDEIGVAEEQLSGMQRQVRGTITQQRHLADLGLAVSKINHDLRNILASASLFSDRLTSLQDPTVKRLAPRLVRTIDRAVDYTSSVLAYGKAGEDIPKRGVLRLYQLLEEVAQVLALDLEDDIEWRNEVSETLEVEADPDQLFRVILNLCRNSVQVMMSDKAADTSVVKRLTVRAEHRNGQAHIFVSDTGPGFPAEARDNIFSAFHSSTKQGGTGLGLAIAADLVRGHGGTIALLETTEPGAHFEITLPVSVSAK